MDPFEQLNYEKDQSLGIIKLDRSKDRNALNRALRLELAEALRLAIADASVRVILLAGNGDSFCAGADLNERLPGMEQDGFVIEILQREYNPIIRMITTADKPVISVVNGAAAGFGAAIALASDLMIMANNAYLYSAFGAISLIPDGGSHKFLRDALGPKKAYEVIAFSQRITAQQCLELGIANRLAEPHALLAEARQWGLTLAQQAPLTLRFSKRILHSLDGADLEHCLEQEALVQNAAFRSKDFAEGALAFFEKRQPQFKGL
jgi:2-(1,2-epoxy-1,2-dihydrophenyl)acetyl-CoA isomerase